MKFNLGIRYFLLFLIFLLASVNTFGQNTFLLGLVTKINSNNQPLFPVAIKSDFANPTRTESNGIFKLIFNKINPGGKVIITLDYKDWIVVNEKELSTKISNNPLRDTLKFYMCNKSELDNNRITYYNVSIASITKSFKTKINELNKQSHEYLERVKNLSEERDNLIKQSYELADKYSKINFDDVSPKEKNAFIEFQKGNIEIAIQILESIDSKDLIKKAQSEIDKWSGIESEANDAINAAKKVRENQIQKLMRQAELYKLNFQWGKAQETYEIAAIADTNSFENVYAFANFLLSQNSFKESYEWFIRSLKAAKKIEDSGYVFNKMGIILVEEKKYDSSKVNYKKAINIFSNLINTDRNFETILAKSYKGLGSVYQELSELDIADDYYQKSLKILLRLDTTNNVENLNNLAECYMNLGALLADKKNYTTSRYYIEKAIDIFVKLVKLNPTDYEPDLATAYINFGVNYYQLKDFTKAEELYKKGMDILERIVKVNPALNEPYIMLAYRNLGDMYLSLNKFSKAKEIYENGLNVIKRLANENPEVYESTLADLYENLGSVYYYLTQFDKAVETWLLAAEIRERFVAENFNIYGIRLFEIYENFGIVFTAQKEYLKAVEFYRKTLEVGEKLINNNVAMNEYNLIRDYVSLSTIYLDKKEYSSSIEILLKESDMIPKLKNEDSIAQQFQISDNNYNLGYVYFYGLQNSIVSEDYCKKALDVRRPFMSDSSDINTIAFAKIYDILGSINFTKKSYRTSKGYYIKALTFYKKRESIYKNEILEINNKLTEIDTQLQ